MRTFAGAGAIGALSPVAGTFTFGAVTSCVTNITLLVRFGHNSFLRCAQHYCDRSSNRHGNLLFARLMRGMPDSPEKDPRVYLAAERTLLAWIRTGLAMMGFGFVVARFGLFLREIQAVQQGTPIESARGSLWFGITLVLMGVLVNLSAVIRHARLVRELREGDWNADRPSRSGMVVAIVLAIAGLAVAAYLLTVR